LDRREVSGMNWDRIEGGWKTLRGRIREQWGRLTDDDLDAIGGRRDQFVGKLQERYGLAREEAEDALRSWERTLEPKS
jgi:uncharacterized protein YjbJ (UPF0337 family)